jgi:hypothetical protein
MRQPYNLGMKLAVWLAIGAVAARAGLAGSGSALLDSARPAAAQDGSNITIALDTDISDGPCKDIDTDLTVPVDQTFQVAVCISDLPVALAVSAYHVIYDDTVIVAPEVEDKNFGLDDNPDVNAGDTTWGDSLGDKIDCTGQLMAYPAGDKDRSSGPAHGEAFASCTNLRGPWPLGDNTDHGVLGAITFKSLKDGTTSLKIVSAVLGDPNVLELGTCNPEVTYPMTCNGATVNVGKGGQAPATAAGETASPQAGATTASPESTAAPQGQSSQAGGTSASIGGDDGGGNGWVLPVVIGVVAGVVVIAAVFGIYRRRRQVR